MEREDKSTTTAEGATIRALAVPRRGVYSQLPRSNNHCQTKGTSEFERLVYGSLETGIF